MRVSGTIAHNVCVRVHAHVCACVVCTCGYILYIVYTYRYSILWSLSKKNTKRHGGAGQVGVISPVTDNIYREYPIPLSLLSHFVVFHRMLFRALAPQARSPLLIGTCRGHTFPRLRLPENRGSLPMLRF